MSETVNMETFEGAETDCCPLMPTVLTRLVPSETSINSCSELFTESPGSVADSCLEYVSPSSTSPPPEIESFEAYEPECDEIDYVDISNQDHFMIDDGTVRFLPTGRTRNHSGLQRSLASEVRVWSYLRMKMDYIVILLVIVLNVTFLLLILFL